MIQEEDPISREEEVKLRNLIKMCVTIVMSQATGSVTVKEIAES